MSALSTDSRPLSPLGEAALEWGRAGFAVFPCWPRNKTPLTPHGFKDATDDEAQIRAWWTRWPNANIGLPTGEVNGLIVVDPDSEKAEKLLARLEARFSKLPPTSESTTGRGRHLVFELPEGCGPVKSSNGKEGEEGREDEDLDIKADGGYIIAPPSIHPHGKTYEWDEKSPDQFAEAPQWLLDFARDRKSVLKALDGPTAAEGGSGGKGDKGLTSGGHPEPRLGREAAERTPTPEPWTEAGKERLRSALAAIPADNRDIWLKVGFALYDLAAADPRWPSRPMWDEWSKTSKKFNEADQDKNWKSFVGRVSGGSRATVATIYHLAKEQGWVPPASPSDEAAKDRPVIRIVGGGLSQEADQGEQALLDSGEPIYSRGGALVRPISEVVRAADVTMPDGQRIKRKTITARLQEFTEPILSYWLCRVADFQKYDARAKKWVGIDPPERLARTVLSKKGGGKFPQISGLITTPTLRPDYSILAEPGYDAETQLYHVFDRGLKMPDTAKVPSRPEALEALELLRDLLTGFPFVSPVDRAVALSGIMTAVLRGALPVAPLHGFSAPTAGSGKSFLADVAATIATGRLCPVIAAGKTEEETEKRLGALIHGGAPIISLDNVSDQLGGDMLCQLTERGKVHVRTLGKSEAPEFDSKSTVFATGNGLTIAGDMVRRTVLCRLDPKLERPELREFQFDPIVRILQNRGAYVAACLTIARAYKAAGAPVVCSPFASYEGWTAMVRAPLIWLDEGDPVASVEKIREGDPELSMIRELFAMWPDHFSKLEPLTTSAIIDAAIDKHPYTYGASPKFLRPELHDLLVRRAGVGNQISSKRLGQWLKTIAAGKIVNGLRLEVTESRGHGNRFCLRPASTGA